MRGILLFLNILFVVVGLALIGIGIYIKVANNFAAIINQFTSADDFSAQSLGFLAFVMIGGGVFTLLIALFGCMGTLWNNRCLLYMYAIIVGIVMIIEFVGFILAFVYKAKLTDVYETALSRILLTGLKNNDTRILAIFADLEKQMDCCGANNISDYYQYNVTKFSDECQKHPNAGDGCSAAIVNFLKKNLPVIYWSLGSLLILEVFGLLGAIILAIALKNAPDETYSSRPGEVLGNMVSSRRRTYR